MTEETDSWVQVENPNEGLPYYDLIVGIDEIRDLMRFTKDENDSEENPDLELELDKETGLYYLDLDPMRYYSVLHWQLITELLIEKVEQVDWRRTTCFYSPKLLYRFFNTHSRPLIYGENLPEIQEKYIVVGSLVMRSPELTRLDATVLKYFTFKFAEDKFLWFADTLPTKDDSFYAATPSNYIPSDIVIWEYLVANEYADKDADESGSEESWRYFHPEALMSHIQLIADHRGGKRAAEIIRLLREDWKAIKAMNLFHIDELTPEQVEAFEQCLFVGLDRNLRSWESEEPKEQAVEPIKCRYIDLDKIAETCIHTPEEFARSLRQACEQDAPALGAFLKKYFKLGYLDFHGDSKKKIYEHLKECFPDGLNYSYTNFTLYFD